MKYMKMMTKNMMTMPMPSNINIWWNLGSILGLCLIMQIFSGMLLSMNYCPSISYAFKSVVNLCKNSPQGWLIRNVHINGASLFFISLFMHTMRGIYFSSFKNKLTWFIGVTILLLSMMTAFLGYVLPWGQMSYWGATVITNLLSAIPYVGMSLVEWIWGGGSINNSTLNRFYSLHFIMPFIVAVLVIAHIMALHIKGSSNPLGVKSQLYMIPFHPYFTFKDLVGFVITVAILMTISTQAPLMLMDPDNFITANPLVTPPHIKPEWYFLFAYSILRSVPSKLGGVVLLMSSILILYPLMFINQPNKSLKFLPMSQINFWHMLSILIVLSWTGGCSIEPPMTHISILYSVFYFLSYFVIMLSYEVWEKTLN